VLEGLTPPVHYLPGNHDIVVDKHDATMQIYTDNFGELISMHEYHGVVCLFVYTEPLAKSFSVPSYQPLKELETRLKQADGKPVIVFHHSPSVDDFYANKMHEGWQKDVREQWIELLNKYDVKAVIAGHFHRDEHHWLGNVPLYVSSSIANSRGRQTTYRIYEYKDGKIGYRTQYIQ
jgi:UDP-2,3-diacylglucosamine pyrophosphatase LpxH